MSGFGEPPYQQGRNGASRSSIPSGAAKPSRNVAGTPPSRSRSAQARPTGQSPQRNFWQFLFGIGRSRPGKPPAQRQSHSVRGDSFPQLPPVQQPRSLQSTASTSGKLRGQTSRPHLNGSANGQRPVNGSANGQRSAPISSSNHAVRSLPARRLVRQPSDNLAIAGRSSPNLMPQRPATSPQRKRRSESSKPPSRRKGAALYAARILILSLGVGVLAGTLLSAWDPASRTVDASKRSPKQAAVKPVNADQSELKPILLGSEITALKASIQTLTTQDPKLQAGTFFLDLDTNAYVDVNGSAPFSAASTIKFPILVAFFQDVDAGKIRLDEPLTMTKELIAKESGEMQFQPPGTTFTALETATKMIDISDNTATNMLIARLGGMSALNQRFKAWGLTTTTINNVLPDLEGTNQASAKELGLLLARVGRGDLVSVKSRDRMLAIMQKTVTDSMLPRGLGEGATIAHKTGDIGLTVGDVGLIDLPNGKRYVGTVFVKRPFNDYRGPELVRQISRLTYQNFARSNPAPTPVPSPAGTPSPAATNSSEPL